MRTHVFLITALALATCSNAYARADAASTSANEARLQAAQAAELKGDIARAREDFQIAASWYERAAGYNRKNSELYNKLGIVRLKLHENDAARKSFERAAKVDPQNASVLNNLGAVSCLDKKYKNAVKYLKRALALDETMASAHLNMAEAWLGLKEVDRSMTEYARAIELDPDILDSGRNGVIAQIRTPEQRARINYLIARAYAKRGNIEAALEYLQRAKVGRFPDMKRVYDEQEFAMLWTDPRLEKIVKR
ncbi:MAG TPA: tetratricopeptide repeat protein [Terracidiphilus sp.]|nr:tetratricopeptide repeat protein [Terracidiphilus sp.]